MTFLRGKEGNGERGVMLIVEGEMMVSLAKKSEEERRRE